MSRIRQSDTSFDDYDLQEVTEHQEQAAEGLLNTYLMQPDSDLSRTNPWGMHGHTTINPLE
jgi:hypothetical protein